MIIIEESQYLLTDIHSSPKKTKFHQLHWKLIWGLSKSPWSNRHPLTGTRKVLNSQGASGLRMLQELIGLESHTRILTGEGQHHLKRTFSHTIQYMPSYIFSLTFLTLSHSINAWHRYKSDLGQNIRFSQSSEKMDRLELAATWPWLVLDQLIN